MTKSTEYGIEARGNRLRILVWGGAAALLALPAIAMRLHAEGVDWSATDFIVFGAMLVVACGLYELATRMSGDLRYRAAAGIAVATGFLTVWANLAVGMIGDEGNPMNLVFAGVLGIAIVGAVFAKLRAPAMAKAMFAAAIAQATTAPLALAQGEGRAAFLIACFALPWLLSAWLFRASARGRVAGA